MRERSGRAGSHQVVPQVPIVKGSATASPRSLVEALATLDDVNPFRRETIDGRTFEFKPLVIYDSATLSPGSRMAEFRFSGKPGTAPSDLIEEDEEPLVAAMVHVDPVRRFLLHELGLGERPAWILLAAPRSRVIPGRPDGKPGDFDLICGPIAGDRLRYDYLAEAEVKVRRLDQSGDLRRSGSGRGTTQARGAAELGFDRTLLLHFMVSPTVAPPVGKEPTWDSYSGPSFSAMEAAAREALEYEAKTEPPYGVALLGLGQVVGTDFQLAGAISPVSLRPPPFRPLHDQAAVRTARQEVERALESHLGSSRPASLLFAYCARCHQLFTPRSPSDVRCC